MEFQEKLKELFRYGPSAWDRLVANNSTFFQSQKEADALNAVIAQVRLNAFAITSPQNEQECYELFETVLGKLLSEGTLAVPSYGLSKQGRVEYDKLISVYVDSRQPPPDPMDTVVEVYRTNKAEFTARRANDAEFARLSDEALAQGRLH